MEAPVSVRITENPLTHDNRVAGVLDSDGFLHSAHSNHMRLLEDHESSEEKVSERLFEETAALDRRNPLLEERIPFHAAAGYMLEPIAEAIWNERTNVSRCSTTCGAVRRGSGSQVHPSVPRFTQPKLRSLWGCCERDESLYRKEGPLLFFGRMIIASHWYSWNANYPTYRSICLGYRKSKTAVLIFEPKIHRRPMLRFLVFDKSKTCNSGKVLGTTLPISSF